MRLLRLARFLVLPLALSVVPVALHAQIRMGIGLNINVGFAPPVLPVYVQPMCPEPNLMWTPGYWAYGGADYFWVPGAWVPAPYGGALWTPPYWGFAGGQYGFHGGYWGQTVGFYGGVNYGFGFGGIGFAGGEWRVGSFAYNTAVTQVNVNIIHTTYVDKTIVERGVVANPNHVAYNGGPGGIQHEANAQEQEAAKQPHTAPTSFQTQHAAAAKADKSSYAKANGGHPTKLVAAKPLAVAHTAPPKGMKPVALTTEKAEPKAAPKAEEKAAPKAEPKAAPKTEEKAAPKAEPKTMPKAESKAAPKAEERATPKAEPKSEPKAAPKAEPKAMPKAEPKAAPKAEERATPKAEPKSEPKSEPKAAPRTEEKAAPKAEPKAAPRPAPKPAPRAAPKPVEHAAPKPAAPKAAPKPEEKPK